LISNGGSVSDYSTDDIGSNAGSSGTVRVSGSGSSWTDRGDLTVGDNGPGTLTITSGALVSDSNGLIGNGTDSSGMATVSGAGSTWTSTGTLIVGGSGTGTLLITNGGAVSSVSSNYGGTIGYSLGSSGMVTVTGSGSIWTNDGLDVGFEGAATLLISNGGTVSDVNYDNDDYNSYIGGSAGIVTVTGNGSKWIGSAGLYVRGTLLISNGGAVSSGFGTISGTVTVTGSGSIWTNAGLFVGNEGAGTLLISNGGTVVSDNNLSYIGVDGGPGTVTVTGSGSKLTNSGDLDISFAGGTGTLLISSGGALSDEDGYIGVGLYGYFDSGALGTVTVTGSGSKWTNSGDLYLGYNTYSGLYPRYSGNGALTVTNAATVSDSNGVIGNSTGSSGTATVSGAGSKWTNTGSLTVGVGGAGTLQITGGAVVNVAGATTIGSLGTLEFDGNSIFNTGSLAINGGSLVTLGASTFAHSATLGAGGMQIDSGGFNSTFSGVLSGTGGLAKSGAGTITLTGASTYTGATSVKAGTLALTTAASHTASLGNTAITVASGATFAATLAASHFSTVVNAGATGSGTSGATLALEPGSAFSMVDGAIGTFNLRQETSFSGPAFTIGGASGVAPALTFDIGNAATGPDMIDVTKTVTVLATGAKITIDALAGDTSLTAGKYDLITSAGGFSGTGGNGFTLTDTTLAVAGTTYDFSLANSTTADEVLTVSVAAVVPVDQSGPFAGDGRSMPGHGSAPLIGTTAVPEPGSATSLLSAFGAAAGWKLRRRKELPRPPL
jgi:T5SS/PEP-CTERM-associated repeat protein/autotransporter-associated beta strand protein